MLEDIERVLIDRHMLAKRVEELAGEIARDLLAEAENGDADGEITLVPILSGSFIFVADLIRHLPVRMKIRMLAVTSYPGVATASRGSSVVKQLTDLPESLAGCRVLVIDDIFDSGGTLRLAVDMLRQRQPASIRTCVLLRKMRPQALAMPVDYVAFDIPDEFIVGYGLDYDDYYRNLPEIVTLRPEIFRDS